MQSVADWYIFEVNNAYIGEYIESLQEMIKEKIFITVDFEKFSEVKQQFLCGIAGFFG